MIGIEIFSGSGGMALGARMAGIDIKLAVEKDINAAKTYLANHNSTTMVVDEVENVNEFIFDRSNVPLILFGGPPCQGFSNSNRKTRNSKNPKNWLFKEFMKTIGKVEPDWVVIENVPGLKKMEKGFFLEKICDDLHKLGYTPNVKLLNSVNFGVPQKRERLFIVGSRGGIAFEFPKNLLTSNYVTVGDAILDLPNLTNGEMAKVKDYKSGACSEFAKKMRGRKKNPTQNFVSRNSKTVLNRYPFIKQGENWSSIPPHLMSNYKDYSRCHSGIYRRLHIGEPAPVISNYRKSMLIHPTENRGLSVREAARLQSFPDWYSFYGSLPSIQQQVGNAVPPLLAKSVFEQIVSMS